MKRFSVILATLLLAGCAAPMLSASDLEVSEKSFGLYVAKGENVRRISSSVESGCEPGAMFGAEVAFVFDSTSRVRLPVQAKVRRTNVADATETEDFLLPSRFEVPPGASGRVMGVFNTLESPNDFRDADYLIQLFDPASGRVYYERLFHVRGCPA